MELKPGDRVFMAKHFGGKDSGRYPRGSGGVEGDEKLHHVVEHHISGAKSTTSFHTPEGAVQHRNNTILSSKRMENNLKVTLHHNVSVSDALKGEGLSK